MNRLWLICLGLLLMIEVQAQTPEYFPSLDKAQNIFEHEQMLREWRERNPKARGWKWGARNEYDRLRRVDSEGKLPDGSIYKDVSENLDKIRSRQRQARIAKDPEWSPVGPYGTSTLFGVGRINCIAFHPTDPNTYYLGFGQGGIWKTTNGGKSYIPLGDQLPILRISAIAIDPTNPQVLYISVGDFAYVGYDLYTADRKRNTHYGLGIWKSTDGGITWNQTGLKNSLEELNLSLTKSIWINPLNPKEIVTVGTKGIYKSFDAGSSWQQVSNRICSQLVQSPTSPNLLYAAGMYISSIKQGRAGILRSPNGGNNWEELPTGIPPTQAQRVEIAISPVNPGNVYAISCNQNNTFEGFYRSANGGGTWEKAPIAAKNILGSTPDDDYGQGLYDLTILAHPTDANKVYVGGLVLFESSDRGTSWTQCFSYSLFVHPDQHQLAYNPLNKTYYLCNDGGLYTTQQIIPSLNKNPSNWKLSCDGINATSCYRLGIAPDASQVITGAQDNSTYLSSNSNASWQNVFGGDGMEGTFGGNTIYGSYQYGYILGATKNLQSSFLVFPPANNSDRGEWTTPFVYVPKAQKLFIAGGNVHEVPVDKDQNSLKALSNFPKSLTSAYSLESSALAVSQTYPEHIYVAKRAQPFYNSPAQVYHTTDGGATWENINNNLNYASYITYLTVDDDRPERVWATLSNFIAGEKIYYSANGGKVWKNISYNLPNLPANCVVFDSDGVLYIAMDVGVYYLIEGTQEWKPLITNLPNVIVSELEIHKPTKKLYAATFGRGLWVSDLVSYAAPQASAFYNMNTVLYPNPNRGTFSLKTDYDQVEWLDVVDVLGRKLFETTVVPKSLKFGKQFEVPDLIQGLYFVRLHQGTQTKVVKMLVE